MDPAATTTAVTAAATATATAAGAATASGPEQVRAGGRPGGGAASARVAELFEAHARLVLGICRGMLRDPAEAEDAAQQVFLSAFGSLLAGRAPRDEEAWIATIARNECRSRIRSRMREPLAALDGEALEARDDAFEASVRSGDVRALRRALAELPAQQRQAFVLREFSGLSYDELARALSVSLASVESLLFRARQNLRARLEPAFATLNGVVALPLALVRLLASGGGEPAGGVAKIASLPLAAKLAAAGVGAVLVAGGTVGLEQHSRHSSTARPARTPAVARHVRRHVHSPARPTATPRVVAATPVPVVAAAVTHVVSRSGRGSGAAGHSASQGSSPGGSAATTEKRRSGGDGTSHEVSKDGPPAAAPPTGDGPGDDGSGQTTVAEPNDDGSGSGEGPSSPDSSGPGSDGSGSGSGSGEGPGSGEGSGSGSGDSSSPSGSGSGDRSHDDGGSGSGSGSGDGGSGDSHSD